MLTCRNFPTWLQTSPLTAPGDGDPCSGARLLRASPCSELGDFQRPPSTVRKRKSDTVQQLRRSHSSSVRDSAPLGLQFHGSGRDLHSTDQSEENAWGGLGWAVGNG